jgi:hypothetical protein
VNQLFTQTCTTQTTSWVLHGWSTFDPWTCHEHTLIHKTHHGPDLGEASTFPLILFSILSHIQMSFCLMIPKLGVPNFPKLGFQPLWRAKTSCANLRLRWGLKKIYSLCWELSNDMCHATYTHIYRGDS